MKWCSTLSEESDFTAAVAQCSADVRSQLTGSEPTLVIAFWTSHHANHAASLGAHLEREFPGALRVGCSAASVIGGGIELEGRPGLAIAAAQLPGVALSGFHVEAGLLGDASGVAARWSRIAGVDPSHDPDFVLLGDPFTTDGELLSRELDIAFPSGVKIGGLASGGDQPGSTGLLLGSQVYHSGVVGVALSGNIAIDTVLAQGCRPIGLPMFVTRADGNTLQQLDGRTPMELLNELYAQATPSDKELFRSSLFLGIQMRESETEYARGDFLVRNLLGGDPESGALTVAAALEETQVVQFQLRDAETATDDLDQQLAEIEIAAGTARGALLFSCLGRGVSLFGVPNHDSELFQKHLGPLPLAGFFCNGEIGPVQRQTFLHGYTSAFGVFRARSVAA